MTPLDKLGLAITEAGIVWTPQMRKQWDAAKNQEERDRKKIEKRKHG